MKTIYATLLTFVMFTSVAFAEGYALTPQSCRPVALMAGVMEDSGYELVVTTFGTDGLLYVHYVGPEESWMLHVTNGDLECHLIGGNGVFFPEEGDPA